MTATLRPLTGSVMTAARQALQALRRVNDELTRAGEAIIRSARVSQPRPRIQAHLARPAQPGAVTERAHQTA